MIHFDEVYNPTCSSFNPMGEKANQKKASKKYKDDNK